MVYVQNELGKRWYVEDMWMRNGVKECATVTDKVKTEINTERSVVS